MKIILGIAFLTLFMNCSFASSAWTLFNDDTKQRSDFTLDPEKHCVDGKKNLKYSTQQVAKFPLAPAEVKETLLPVLSISTDNGKYEEMSNVLCRFSVLLHSTGCNPDKLKVVARLGHVKTGVPNEGPKGKVYVKQIAVYGCDKLRSDQIPKRCYFPSNFDNNRSYLDMREAQLDTMQFVKFMDRCKADLTAIGNYDLSTLEYGQTQKVISDITHEAPGIVSK